MATARRLGAHALRLTLVSSLAISDLAGCASGGNMFSSRPDPSDSCGQQHVAFADSQNYYLSEAVQGAFLGALGGAALGALTAASTGGNVGTGAAIGAGTGAVVGAADAYYNAKQKQAADQAALTQSVNSDLAQAATELDRVTTTFHLLYACRWAATAQIKDAYKAGQLSRDAAMAKLADQKKRFTEELQLAHKYGAKMADQEKSFAYASQSISKDDPAAQQIVQNPSAYAPSRYADAGSAPVAGDYTVKAAANVRKDASAQAQLLNTLAPGTKVQVAGDATADGWRKIALANGQTGFVRDSVLNPPGGGAAAAPVTASAGPSPAESGDKKVQVAYAATETIPQKRQSYDKAVGDADSQSNLAFNLDQATPPT